MLRAICAVLVGYVVMAVLIMGFFAIALVKPDFAYVEKSLDVKTSFAVATLGVSVVAAILGGLVAFRIARRSTLSVVVVFALIGVAVGVAEAARQTQRTKPKVTPEEVAKMSIRERAEKSVQPTWYAWTLPALVGPSILVGGLLGRRWWPGLASLGRIK